MSLIGWILLLVGIFFIDMETNSLTKNLVMLSGCIIIIIAKIKIWWKHD